jgi:tetracycline 7-halogenase / FADH2 O2-dependent halogenase
VKLRLEADVAIVGSGFGGSLTALALRKRGRSIVLLERGRHPRFAIGESSTPLANLLLEELADRYDLPRLRPLCKWGPWQRAYPEVACGKKRGFSFFAHGDDARERERPLLVAASPHDEIADTHWYRPDVDLFLLREAEEAGATYLDETILDAASFGDEGAVLEGTRKGRPVRVCASFVVDGSGPRGFLHRALGLPETKLRWLPATQGLYTHFADVARFDDLFPVDDPPYPVDDAAVHHVCPGGWIWVLRFNNGITSAGVAAIHSHADALRLADGASAWERLLASLPRVRAQFRNARAVIPFVYSPRVAFRSAVVTGPRWALLPSAAGVIDPLLSTGFPLNLLGLHRLLDVLEKAGRARDEALLDYAKQTTDELDATERLVAALYATMQDFELFKRMSLLYFAAASFSETVRRLGRPEKARGFLLHADPRFGPALRACADAAAGRPQGKDREALFQRIDEAIEPFDVAGLRDRSRKDRYPVLAEDLLAAAPKLGATEGEVERLLERCGLRPVSSARS